MSIRLFSAMPGRRPEGKFWLKALHTIHMQHSVLKLFLHARRLHRWALEYFDYLKALVFEKAKSGQFVFVPKDEAGVGNTRQQVRAVDVIACTSTQLQRCGPSPATALLIEPIFTKF